MRPLLHLLFFLSGFCGLVYEVVWFKWLHLVLGVTIHSVTAVFAAFMVGLALGSRFFGRISARLAHPLAAYGWLELGIGAVTLFMPQFIRFAGSLQDPFYGSLLDQRPLLVLFRLLLAFICLFPATFLMGGSFPMIAEHVTRSFSNPERAISTLYAANTIGAAVGAATAGFVLVEALGLQASSDVASLINVLLGLVAIFIPRNPSFPAQASAVSGDPQSAADPSAPLSNPEPAPASLPPFLLATAVAGFAAMGYEVCWNRFIPLVIGSTTYGFSLILTAFLAGLAAGSLASARLQGQPESDLRRVGGLLLLGATCSALLLPVFGRLPHGFLALRQSLQVSFTTFHAIQFSLLFLLFLPVTFCFGALFPLIARAIGRSSTTGVAVGTAFWWNTLGTVAGILLTGLVLIPSFGIKQTMFLLIAGNAAAGLYLLASVPVLPSGWRLASGLAVLGIGLGICSGGWDRSVLTSGVFRYWRVYTPETMGHLGSSFLYFREGVSGTVSVERDEECLSLRIDGKPDASTTRMDMSTQRLTAALPLALANSRKRVLVVGLGSGVSAGTSLLFPDLEKLDILEINPAVVEASTWFADVNDRFWENPKTRIIREDARNYVTFTRETYDVIVAEPTNLWISGMSGLFSLEAYRSYDRVLADGGLIAQFVHLYELSPIVLASVMTTFREVFPNTTVWMTSSNDLLMIGQKGAAPFDYGKLDRLLTEASLRERLAGLGLDRPHLLQSLLLATPQDVATFSGIGPLNTDDMPFIDLAAPVSFYENDRVKPDYVGRIFQTPSHPLAQRFHAASFTTEDWNSLGALWEEFHIDPIARQAYRASLDLNPHQPPIERRLAANLSRAGEHRQAATILSHLAQRSGLEDDFGRCLEYAAKLDRNFPPLLEGRVFASATALLDRWKTACPLSPRPWQEEGALLATTFPASAARALERSLEMIRQNGKVDSPAWHSTRLTLSKLWARLNRASEAAAIWQELATSATAPRDLVRQARILLEALHR